MSLTFNSPSPNITEQDTYQSKEVGLVHPNVSSYIKLNDKGDIEITVDDGLAIVLHKKSRSITFVCDTLKILTKDGDSIRWNNSNLNSRATDFTQPALIPLVVRDTPTHFNGSEDYLSDWGD